MGQRQMGEDDVEELSLADLLTLQFLHRIPYRWGGSSETRFVVACCCWTSITPPAPVGMASLKAPWGVGAALRGRIASPCCAEQEEEEDNKVAEVEYASRPFIVARDNRRRFSVAYWPPDPTAAAPFAGGRSRLLSILLLFEDDDGDNDDDDVGNIF